MTFGIDALGTAGDIYEAYYRLGHVWHSEYCFWCKLYTLHRDGICQVHGQGTTAGKPGR